MAQDTVKKKKKMKGLTSVEWTSKKTRHTQRTYVTRWKNLRKTVS